MSDLSDLHVVTIRALVKPDAKVDVQALFDAAPAFFAEHGVTAEWREVYRQTPREFFLGEAAVTTAARTDAPAV